MSTTPLRVDRGYRPADRGASPTRVRDVMTGAVLTLSPGDNLGTALSRLRMGGVSGCPVTSEQGDVLGVLSERDIATALGDAWVHARPKAVVDLVMGEFPWSRPDALRELRDRLTTLTVAEAMTRDPEVVDASASLGEAAWRMRYRGVNRLPVVEGGKLVGIIARRDLIGAWPSAAPEAQTAEY